MESYRIVKRLNVLEHTQPGFLQVSKRLVIGPPVFQRPGLSRLNRRLPATEWMQVIQENACGAILAIPTETLKIHGGQDSPSSAAVVFQFSHFGR